MKDKNEMLKEKYDKKRKEELMRDAQQLTLAFFSAVGMVTLFFLILTLLQ